MKTLEDFVPVADGMRLHHRVIGTGADTVIVPGKAWISRQLDALADDFTLVLYDTRGRGRSDALTPTTTLRIEDEIADIEALRRRIKADRISLIGWSYLGALVARYADAHPQHVSRIVQIGPQPPRSDPYWPEYQRSMDSRIQALSAKNVKDQEADGGFPLRAMVQAGLGDPSIADRILAEVGTDLPNESPKALGVWLERLLQSGNKEWDHRPHAQRVTCPVLTVHGTADNVPIAASREWVTILPNARLLVIEGVGHYPMYEARDMLVDALRDFLGGKWPDAASVPGQESAGLADQRKDHISVAASMEKYLATLRTNNADAVASWWTTDAIYMPAGIRTFRGSADLNSFLKEAYGSIRVDYHSLDAEDILVSGDLAVVAGTFNETLNPKSSASSALRGRYVLVWQRQLDGAWKILRGIGTDWQEGKQSGR